MHSLQTRIYPTIQAFAYSIHINLVFCIHVSILQYEHSLTRYIIEYSISFFAVPTDHFGQIIFNWSRIRATNTWSVLSMWKLRNKMHIYNVRKFCSNDAAPLENCLKFHILSLIHYTFLRVTSLCIQYFSSMTRPCAALSGLASNTTLLRRWAKNDKKL
jgi:hypothetical protein